MGMVDRYKKAGGFIQLIQVIETCNTKKREQFMKIISEENPEWAEALNQKCLSFEKILSWKAEAILEIIASVNMLSFTASLKSLEPEKLELFLQKLSNQDRKKFELALVEAQLSPNEISASVQKVIGETRLLFVQGSLKADKIDPSLVIPDDYEFMLGRNEQSRHSGGASGAGGSAATATLSFDIPASPAAVNASVSSLNAEFDKIQKRIVLLTREVQTLKSENQVMKDKLEKIKKIA